MEPERKPAVDLRFIARAAVASVALVAVYAVARGAWVVIDTLLLAYIAIIAAIGLRAAAVWLAQRTPLGVGPALSVVIVALVAAPVIGGVAIAPKLTEQVREAEAQLPELKDRLDRWLTRAEGQVRDVTGVPAPTPAQDSPKSQSTGQGASDGAAGPTGATGSTGGATAPPQGTSEAPQPQPAPDAGSAPDAKGKGAKAAQSPPGPGPTDKVVQQLQSGPSTQILGWITGFVGGVSQAGLGLLLVAVLAVYLAASPEPYVRGLVALVPRDREARARQILAELRDQLAAWVIAQIVTMVIVGVLTTVGLMIAGVRFALLLGIVAGILDFIPNFGPAIAAVPAVLLAAGEGKAVPVLVVYGVVQVLEGWVLRPLIERKAVDTLPALLLGIQVALATLIGFMGLLTAPALIVLGTVLTRRLYVEDALGRDPDAEPDAA
ncbi:MAG: AI-2E family transporter [Myxococcota bacterium]